MSDKINFIKATIERLGPASDGKRDYYNDTKVPGLQLQVTAKGVKTFYVYRRINGRPKRIKLGRFPDMTTQKARKKAEAIIGEIASGGDPMERKRRERADTVTLKEALEEYTNTRQLKEKTAYDYRKVLNTGLKDWQGKQLQRISKDMVANRHQKLGRERGEPYANLTMRIFRAVYNFAAAKYEDDEGNSLLPPNPVLRISNTRSWFKDKRRSDYITEAELPAWFKAVLGYKHKTTGDSSGRTVADFLLMLILTGLRRSEAAPLKWEQIDLANKTLIIRDTKNHEDHTLPLSDYLLALIEERRALVDAKCEWVFPSNRMESYLKEPRNHVAAISKAAGVPFLLHDLRRTFVTYAERLDISAYAVKRLVNHKVKQDVTAGYIGVDVERLRKPMQQITDFLLKTGKVKSSAKIVLLDQHSMNKGRDQ
ncbi:MAG: integrase family protein [Candidatus Thiodiazotropha endolucinida]